MKKVMSKIFLISILGIFLINFNIDLIYAKNNYPSFENITCKIYFKDKTSVDLLLDIADTEEKRSFGLMHRKYMDSNAGMLFVWEESEIRNFWMANTFLDLDLFFLNAKGIVIDIHKKAKAMDKTNIQSKEKAKLVLELQTGKLNAALGDKLICPIL